MVGSLSAVAAEADIEAEVEWRGIGTEKFITFVPTADDEAAGTPAGDDCDEAREKSPEGLSPREGLFLLLLDAFMTRGLGWYERT